MSAPISISAPTKAKLESLVDTKRSCDVCKKDIDLRKNKNARRDANTQKYYCSIKCMTEHMKPEEVVS